MHSLFQLLAHLDSKPDLHDYSYLSNSQSCALLSKNQLQFYQEEKFFTYKCPIPSFVDCLSQINLTQSYEKQEAQYLNTQSKASLYATNNNNLSMDNLLNLIYNSFPQSSKIFKTNSNNNMESQRSNLPNGTQVHMSQDGYEPFREFIPLSVQLKSRLILSFLITIALILVIFRIMRRSESMKQKLPKTLSIFWFYSTITLYFELNVLSLDTKPVNKVLIYCLTSLDSTSIYIPEILHLILFIVTLLYFFSLIFRFNELLGQPQGFAANHENLDELVQQINRELRQQQDNQPQQANNGPTQNRLPPQQQQPLLQIEPISVRSSLEFYHFSVLHILLFISFVKLILQYSGILFLKITSFGINLIDNMEVIPNSPRLLSLFTISYLAFSQFIGKTSIDKTQYVIIKVVPFLIALLHSTILILKRRYLFTIDDLMFLLMFITSIALYFTYESPSAAANNRHPWPFLHSETKKKLLQDQCLQNVIKNLPSNMQTSGMVPPGLTEDEQLKILQEDAKKRKELIKESQRQRAKQHEDYLRQKALLNKNKFSGQFAEEEFQRRFDNQFGNVELDDDDSDEDNNQSPFQQQNRPLSSEERKHQTISHFFTSDLNSKATQEKLKEILLQQINQLNEDTKKILQINGGIDFSNNGEVLKKIELIQKLKQISSQQQQQQLLQQQNEALRQQQLFQQQQLLQQPAQAAQILTTQGGQGQQQSIQKQTAHKAPTKAPTGRPNQRKRR